MSTTTEWTTVDIIIIFAIIFGVAFLLSGILICIICLLQKKERNYYEGYNQNNNSRPGSGIVLGQPTYAPSPVPAPSTAAPAPAPASAAPSRTNQS